MYLFGGWGFSFLILSKDIVIMEWMILFLYFFYIFLMFEKYINFVYNILYLLRMKVLGGFEDSGYVCC